MQSDTPPGQVLSTVFSPSLKRRSSKIGGCADVLFQIFHGKRFFSRKSLPAERPKQGSINHTDDKLPIAKLLLIADENRGGSLKDTPEELEKDNAPKGESCEEQPSCRTLNVVARLMGLETMPPPEGEQRQLDRHKKDMDCQFPVNVSRGRHTSVATSVTLKSQASLYGPKPKEPIRSLPGKYVTQQKNPASWKEKAKNEVSKRKVLSKGPSLPPHHMDSSFPSVMSASKRGETMQIKKTTHLLEATAKMHETSSQSKLPSSNQRLQSSLSRTKNASFNVAKSYKGHSGREQACEDSKIQAVGRLSTTVVPAPDNQCEAVKTEFLLKNGSKAKRSRRRSAPFTTNQEFHRPQFGHVGPQYVVGQGKRLVHEVAPVQKKHIYQQQEFTQPGAHVSVKVKPIWRRQEEMSRRLSQRASCNTITAQRSRVLGTAQLRHPSPPKSFQDSSGGPSSSQASNSVILSNKGTQPISSHVSSNSVSTTSIRSGSSLSVNGFLAQLKEASDCEEAIPPAETLYNKHSDLQLENLSQSPSLSVLLQVHSTDEGDNSSYAHVVSSSSTIYTESHRRSSMESSLSSDPSLSELTSSSEDFFLPRIGITGHERVQAKYELSGDSLESKFDSLSGEFTDTASSHARDESALACSSGKNTAAILQELLTVLLNSNRSPHDKLKDSRTECSGSPSFESDFKQVKKHAVPVLDSSVDTKDLSYAKHERPCFTVQPREDSAFLNSIESSETSQGRQPCKSTDFMSTVVENEDSESFADVIKPERIHGVSEECTKVVDCEALLNTISKLHYIDPEVIGLNAKAIKNQSQEKGNKYLIDSARFDKLEEQAQWIDRGVSMSSSLSAEDDADSTYTSSRSQYEDAAVQNKKLVSDCIDEAFKSLSKQLYEFSSSLSRPSSATHVLNRVNKQIDEWRGMAIGMNLDDMVEKEMNATTRRWRNIGVQAEEVAEVVENTIFSGLIEEVLLELI